MRLWYNIGVADNVDLTSSQIGRFLSDLEEDSIKEIKLIEQGKCLEFHGKGRPSFMNFICNWAYPWKKRERLNWPVFNIS